MRIILLIIMLVFAGHANAQTPNYVWAKSTGGDGMDNGNCVATDAAGNILVAGYYTSASITFGATTLTNADNLGTADMFLVKYDAGGNVLWAKGAGGTNNDYGQSITTDASGNIIVTGSFSSATITFGTTTLINAIVNRSDFYIVKYDAGGNVLWAKSAGGSDWDHGISVATDAGGNILATGYYASTLITFGTTSLTNAGIFDVFVVKYDALGNVLWAKKEGGSGSDISTGVTTDNAGNILVTGGFASSTFTVGTSTLTNTGDGNAFLLKYDAAGNVLWAKGTGGSGFDKGTSVATDLNGNIILSGYFNSAAITFGTTTLTKAGGADIFLVKYDAGGTVLWAKREGGVHHCWGNSVVADPAGNILLAGYFYNSAFTVGSTTLPNAGLEDIFLVKYDAGGNVLWAKGAGGNNTDESSSLAIDASGNIFLTGFFVSPSLSFGTNTLTNAGGLDVFLVKLSNAATGMKENDLANAIEIFPNPFSTQATLQTGSPLHNATLTLYNSTGQTVARMENISGQRMIINRDNLPAGFYFVHLTQDNSLQATRKLIITD